MVILKAKFSSKHFNLKITNIKHIFIANKQWRSFKNSKCIKKTSGKWSILVCWVTNFNPDSFLVLTSANLTLLPPSPDFSPLSLATSASITVSLLQVIKALVFHLFFLDTLCFAAFCRHESGRCHSFLPFLSIFFVYPPFQVFFLH